MHKSAMEYSQHKMVKIASEHSTVTYTGQFD